MAYIRIPFAEAGDRTAVPEASQPSGAVSYTDGFTVDYQLEQGVDPDAKDVPRQEFNQIIYATQVPIQQYQQFGFPDFITTSDNGGTPFSYSANATVRYNGINYFSLVDFNTELPTNAAFWGVVQYASPEPAGIAKPYYGASLPAGYVWANGTTIGNASSGATGRANADTVRLFTELWNSTTNATLPLEDSSGVAVSRGISAAADYAANRRIPTPNECGRTGIGKDDMGGITASGRITVAGCGISGTTMAAAGGGQNVALTSNQNGQHAHSGTTASAGAHRHTQLTQAQIPMKFAQSTVAFVAGLASLLGLSADFPSGGNNTETSEAGTHTHTFTTSNSGLGEAHLNVQPSIVRNVIITL